jgi:hypothetical protein
VRPATALAIRLLAGVAAVGLLSGKMVVSCSGDPRSSPDDDDAPSSHAMGRWTPLQPHDTCSRELHDTYFVIGPDGKKYPTWHPPVVQDPDTGDLCSFGHEHGVDPRDSALWSDLRRHFAHDANGDGVIDTGELERSGVPFGLVAEQLEGSATPRPEEHTGYKIALRDNAPRVRLVNGVPQAFELSCDLFAAYNQATSSGDAFASNLFSVTYAIDCNQGADVASYRLKVIVSTMAIYRDPGSFTVSVDGNGNPVLQPAGDAVPPNSPAGGSELGRQIPARERVFANVFVASGDSDYDAGLNERWDTFLRLRRADGTEIATLAPAFRVFAPARYYDNGAADTINLCYYGLNAAGTLVTDPSAASTIVRRARGGVCEREAPNGPGTPVSQRIARTDPESPFNACERAAYFGGDVARNGGGPTTWYTDAFGGLGRTTSFARSIRQFVSAVDTGTITLAEVEETNPSCAESSIHAPN